MNKNLRENSKSIKELLLFFIQHNPRHYIKLNILRKTITPCARCFGLWTGIFVGFILLVPFLLGVFNIQNFVLIFIIAWLFVIPTIVDWGTTKLGLRKGTNSIRIATGFLHGIGLIIYFFILPANILFKISTYLLYDAIFYLIRWRYNLQHYRVK